MAIITISRGTFTGGAALAQAVSEKLGYTCLSREQLLSDAAVQYDMRDEDLQSALNNQPLILPEDKLWKIHYVAYVQATLCRAVKGDNTVYHGQGGHLLLAGVPHVLRIRVIADMEFRIKAACERHKFNRNEAVEYIRKVDQERARWMISMYQANWHDASQCDLVINLEHMSIAAACELVVIAAQGARYKTTSESQKILDNLLLASDVRASIATAARTDQLIKDYEVKVVANRGEIIINGKANSQQEIDKIVQLAGTVPGVREVKPKMRVRTIEEADTLNKAKKINN